MVFTSSIPPYLDPSNWQQQQSTNHHHTSALAGGGVSSHQQQLLSPPQPPSLPPPQPHGAGGMGSIRPGSMADRARMANMPMPEAALKCPRCESTNTKFCYFNNYSLTQPRHFCKTCRRYWTRGGALRNVPVGGGCRRNKRSKGSSSKSPASSDRQGGSTSSTNSVSSNSNSAGELIGLTPHAPPLRFMSPLLADFAAGGGDMGLTYGVNYNAISAPMGGLVSDLNFQIGSSLGGGEGGVGSSGGTTAAMGSSGSGSIFFAPGLEQWRMPQTQQFPFLAGLEGSPGLYSFEGGATGGEGPGYSNSMMSLRPKAVSSTTASGLITQLASVKMEDNNNQEMNLSRQFMGSDQQYWGSSTSAWTDLSGFSSCSTTSNPL